MTVERYVRIIAGTLVDIGQGKRTAESMAEIRSKNPWVSPAAVCSPRSNAVCNVAIVYSGISIVISPFAVTRGRSHQDPRPHDKGPYFSDAAEKYKSHLRGILIDTLTQKSRFAWPAGNGGRRESAT